MDNAHLSDKQAAMRARFLLELNQRSVTDESGSATNVLCERCQVSDWFNRSYVGSVLRAMEANNEISREINGRRTVGISIKRRLSPKEIQELEAQSSQLSHFNETEEERLNRLYDDCVKAQVALQAAAKNATQISSNGLVAVKGGQIIRNCLGSASKRRAQEIKHYLKELGVAKAIKQANEVERLWYWKISDTVVKREALMAVIKSGRSYENAQSLRKGRSADQFSTEENRRQRMYAPTTPAILPNAAVSPLQVGRIKASNKASHAPSKLDQLVKVVELLEAKVEELEGQIITKDSEINELKAEIKKLKSQLNADEQSAKEVLERYADKLK